MSGKIPKAFIDEVLVRTSLVEFIDSHVSLVKRGKNYLACCPFHHEKTPSFNVSPDKQFYFCFGCNASGNAISFAMNYLNKDFVTAIEDLAGRIGMTVVYENGSKATNNVSHLKIYGFLDEISQYYHQILNQDSDAKTYLANRGLTKKTIDHFQLGFAENEWNSLSKKFPANNKALIDTGMLVQNEKGNTYDRYRNRIMFPIYDKRSRVVAFGGRVINPDDKPKYLNSPETPYFHKSNELYGLNHIIKDKPSSILIVEGYMDVIALFEHDICNAVATLGTATSQSHIQTLFKTSKKLIFCFDGDKAGRKAASRALNICLPIINDDETINFMFLDDGEDPDSLVQKKGKQQFEADLNHAQTLEQFFFKELTDQAPSTDPANRSKLVHLAKPLLEIMQKGACKELLLNKLAQLSKIDRERLNSLISADPDKAQTTPTLKLGRPKPSSMRTALAILIQKPSLYKEIEIPLNLELLKQNDNQILSELLKIISEKPHTSQLIEHWRNSEQYIIISKLAVLPLNIPEEGYLAELSGALQQIEKKTLQNQIDRLLYKANIENLSIEEKRQLQGMIRQQKITT